MKINFFLTTLLLILMPYLGVSQITDNRLRENCITDANYWKSILSLSDSETEKLSNIFFTYESNVRDLNKNISDYKEKLEEVERKKQKNLTDLLGNNRYKTYALLQQSSNDFTSNMVSEIRGAMQQDSAFIKEITIQMKSMYPVLIQYHQQIMKQMTKEDYHKLKEIKMGMFHKLDSLNNLNINIIDTITSKKELPKETKAKILTILSIIDNYEKEYEEIMIPLSVHQQKWNKEMEEIFLIHYPKSNLNTMKEYQMFFRQTGINKELDKLLLFMLDPNDEKRYFQSLMIIQTIEENIFSIHKQND